MKDFRDRVAAITGAASGMGRSVALELARRGCHLALSDIDDAGLAATARMAAETGRTRVRVTTAPVDVADRLAVNRWATEVVDDHGRVNLIVNNAGLSISKPLLETTEHDWDLQHEVMAKGS